MPWTALPWTPGPWLELHKMSREPRPPGPPSCGPLATFFQDHPNPDRSHPDRLHTTRQATPHKLVVVDVKEKREKKSKRKRKKQEKNKGGKKEKRAQGCTPETGPKIVFFFTKETLREILTKSTKKSDFEP